MVCVGFLDMFFVSTLKLSGKFDCCAQLSGISGYASLIKLLGVWKLLVHQLHVYTSVLSNFP